MPDSPYLLRAEGIGKSFGSFEALKAASVWAEPGKIATLMGRNGSGKTTLLRIAAGVLAPDYGVVSFGGTVRARHSLARMAPLGLMYLPQEQLVVPRYLVIDHFRALRSVFSDARVEEAIETADLGHLLEQSGSALSRGEQVRLSLGLALARRPSVLLADEPLVGLSPRDQEMLGGVLGEVAARGVAIVTSGHDVRVLLTISDIIIWSVAGTTHALGTPDEAMAHDQFRREYLGPA